MSRQQYRIVAAPLQSETAMSKQNTPVMSLIFVAIPLLIILYAMWSGR